MDFVVKKSLAVPMKKLTSCLSGAKDTDVGSKRKEGSSWRTPPHSERAPELLRSYQEDLERERKLREAMNTRKNVERAAMRAHFRRKYHLTQNSKDARHLRAVGGKVVLPRPLSQMVQPKASLKDEGHGLHRAFQGLSFNMGTFTGNKHTNVPSKAAARTEPCRIM